MTTYLFVAGAALLLSGLAVLLWRSWVRLVRRNPRQEAQERELAALNDAQAYRVSDQQLSRPVEPDAAWQTMVQRGQRRQRKDKRRS